MHYFLIDRLMVWGGGGGGGGHCTAFSRRLSVCIVNNYLVSIFLTEINSGYGTDKPVTLMVFCEV